MKNRIQINLGTDHTLECTDKIIGRAGEGLVSRLEITIPDALSNYDAYIDFEKPDGETLRTPKLEAEGNVAFYDVPQYLLIDSGEIKVQLVFEKASGSVWKSSKKRYTILKSINAVEDIPEKEDFISIAQKLIDELSGEVAEIAETLANNADFSQAVIDACGGQTKITTINGKTLRFFVDTQEEYDKLSVAEQQNLFAIITDDKTKEAIFNAIAELQSRADAINTDIDNMTRGLVNGDFVVTKATYATNATNAENATYATNAGIADSTQKDGKGNQIDATYARPSNFDVNTEGLKKYITAPLGAVTVLKVPSAEDASVKNLGIGAWLTHTGKKLSAEKNSTTGFADMMSAVTLVDTIESGFIEVEGTWMLCGQISIVGDDYYSRYLIQRVQ